MHFNSQVSGQKFRLLIAIFLVIFTWAATWQHAYATYAFNKVRIYLSQQHSIDTVQVTNPGDTAANLQAQVYAWTMVDSKDNLTPSNDLIVSPPIMKVPPHKTQLMRLGWRKPTALATEKMYRLFVTEITPEKPLTQTGVRIRLRLGIPVFIAPANPVYRLEWTSQGLSGKKFKVKVTNTGNVHVNLGIVDLYTDDDKKVGTFPSAVYVFPGQSEVIEFVMTDLGTKNLNIRAGTDYKTMQAKITL